MERKAAMTRLLQRASAIDLDFEVAPADQFEFKDSFCGPFQELQGADTAPQGYCGQAELNAPLRNKIA